MCAEPFDKLRAHLLRQSLALQPLAGHLRRVLPVAVNLLVELDKIISGQRGLHGIQGGDSIRIVGNVGANQRDDVLRQDHESCSNPSR